MVGDGEQKRDFVFVSDVVRACMAAAGSNVRSRIFNVGGGRPSSVNKLVELLEGNVVFIPKRPGEPDLTHADISRIERELDWRPEISFKRGVGIMLENIDYWKNAPVWDPDSIAGATREWFEHLGKSGD